MFAAAHFRHNPQHKVGPQYARNPEAVKTARKFTNWQGRKATA
jgi:hypothetical protein